MAEWSIAAVLKTVDLRGSGGSNPSSSAKADENQREGAGFLLRTGMREACFCAGTVKQIARMNAVHRVFIGF
jgi:hypothetical protein